RPSRTSSTTRSGRCWTSSASTTTSSSAAGAGRRAEVGPGRRGAWRLLRSRDFGPYFAGNAVSASGTWFQNLAASILVYRLSHSPFLLGVLNFCQFVPVLVLAPWAGALADRADRRRLLLATQLAAAALSAALAALAWSGLAREGVVIGFAAALGVALALAQPAQMALVPSLVPREDVAQAVALNSATFNLARVVGPVSAAPIIAWQGIGVAFAINACTYLALAAALLAVRPAPQRRAARAGLRDALALLRGRPALVLYLLVVASVSAGSDPVNTESPALAHAFDRSSAWAGAIVGAFGAGAVVAAFGFAGRVSGSRMRMAATLGTMALGMAALRSPPGSRSRSSSSRSPGAATSSRTPPRPRGSSSRSPSTSAAGSWRSGRSRSSASGRSRASSTGRSPAPPASARRRSCSRSPRSRARSPPRPPCAGSRESSDPDYCRRLGAVLSFPCRRGRRRSTGLPPSTTSVAGHVVHERRVEWRAS